MARKKKEVTPESDKQEQVTKTKEAIQDKVTEKRPPQMVTVNGDKVSHAHVYKSNTSDDWFFTAKLNDVPLKPQKVSPEDLEAVLNKTKKPVELMEKYYPTKMMPKKSPEEFKIPTTIMTSEGEKTVHKFNVYKESDMRSPNYQKYLFYAQVGDLKMSAPGSKNTLNAYFDRTETPKELITKVFGEKLHLADYYKQFQLPEGANLEAKDIRLMKNQSSNRYEISADMGSLGKTSVREISYDDRQSYFTHKTATKEQLAAKYLGEEIGNALKNTPKQEKAHQQSLGM